MALLQDDNEKARLEAEMEGNGATSAILAELRAGRATAKERQTAVRRCIMLPDDPLTQNAC